MRRGKSAHRAMPDTTRLPLLRSRRRPLAFERPTRTTKPHDLATIMQPLRERLFTLPDEIWVYPATAATHRDRHPAAGP